MHIICVSSQERRRQMSNERYCVSCGTDCVVYIGDGDERAIMDDWTAWAAICTPCAETLKCAVQEAIDGNTEGAQETIGRFAHEVETRRSSSS
jgi:hypothetical protein